MTKQEFAKLIVETVLNGEEDFKSQSEIVDDIEGLLSIVRPVNYERFALWGRPSQQSNIAGCWTD